MHDPLTQNNNDEMISYCADGVRILREGCIKFMTDSIKISL